MPKDIERTYNRNKLLKIQAIELSKKATKIMESDKSKKGVLLCEGEYTSIDYAVYSVIYPKLIVFPIGGCVEIRKLMPFMRKYCPFKTYGIIDRDNHSKREIEDMKENNNVYCTKLPFIENIICCPEVIEIVAPLKGKFFEDFIEEIQVALASILANKLRHLNPINVYIPEEEEIQVVTITIMTKNGIIVNKLITKQNIMYTFRDKVIVVEVANALGLSNKEAYYKFIAKLLNSRYSKELIKAISKYLPKIK